MIAERVQENARVRGVSCRVTMNRTFAVLLMLPLAPLSRAAEPVNFSREVLPILSANCFACHGPDEAKRKAKLRLDVESEAKKMSAGKAAVAAGKPEASTLMARLESKDADEIMPPPETHKSLKKEQTDLMRRWITEGAQWGRHWSFEPVVRPKGTLDSLVAEALAVKSLKPRESAPPHTLVRRLYLDIVGLPPAPEIADAFAKDPSPAAYARLVDELLKMPQYGEHWARMWLDLARYADTKGYEKDVGRTIWPFRDWVVNALNSDMPLSQFTEEQLAGDLLPNPTQQQLIATAFHRNTMTNDEGGTDNEEFRQVAVKDRVDTTMQVWMGLTMGCAKCHSHKYDPISQTEYYRFYALFNQTEDADLPSDAPNLTLPTPAQQKQLEAAKAKMAATLAKLAEARKQDPKISKGNGPQDDDTPEISKLKADLKTEQDSIKAISDEIAGAPIMRELPAPKQRQTKIHKRGNFLDPGEVVQPGVPAAFHSFPKDAPMNRLGVAKWLVSPDNPLTPRVWANRVWARLFGMGIVETEEDFGALGSLPANPKLLDWLAAEYRDGGWSLKRLIKTVVLSDAYRQSSAITPALTAADPRNALASRGARFRLSAETVRDQALETAGLLSKKMGGWPVMPPQPEGLWRSTYNGKSWIDAEGEDRFRRGLYTYLKRTTPYPSMITFDSGSGEVCLVRRIRTNTPLQALVTLNDRVFLEAAAALAQRMTAQAADPAGRAERGLRLALIRPVTRADTEPLIRLHADVQAEFQHAPDKAAELIRTTRAKLPKDVAAADFAAWIVAANAILNLDEFLTRN